MLHPKTVKRHQAGFGYGKEGCTREQQQQNTKLPA
jgi:hypothetical protein